MSWRVDQIEAAFKEAEEAGASHMIVAHNGVDFDNESIWVMPGEDPVTKFPSRLNVDECYDISLGWEPQRAERRAMHTDWNPLDTGAVT
jgi:hypothetical protein